MDLLLLLLFFPPFVVSSSSPCEGLPFFLSIVQYAVCEDVALNFWCKRIIRVRVCAASSCRTFKDAVPISRKRVKSGDEAAVEHHAAFWVNVPRNAPVTDHARRCWGWITGRLIPVNRFESVLNPRSETDASKSNNISKYNTKEVRVASVGAGFGCQLVQKATNGSPVCYFI